ncbi:MAG: NAD(P)-dependent dehydrogenase (short-subunit alcohol dehydrogenase family) [Natrialbaceae archaeon]|jgi:NAD(P)-dependent dehydrogenase (short-subunit alcohol dehydrogenase family)
MTDDADSTVESNNQGEESGSAADKIAAETVLITGCSSGIGRTTALAFRQNDWTVYATARDESDLEKLAEAGCKTAELDVTDDDSVERVVDRIIEEQGGIDCLVNNAGYAQMGPIEDVPVEDVHRQFDVNVYGPHRLTRAVLPHMRAAEDGTIINVSSVSGRLSFPGGGVYSGSKFALEALSEALRGEVDAFGIDVVLVEPGPVVTNFQDRVEDEVGGLPRSEAYEDIYEIMDDYHAIGGAGPFASEPKDVARVILNAASCTEPGPRYPVGPVAKYGVLARFVPTPMRDAVIGIARRLLG